MNRPLLVRTPAALSSSSEVTMNARGIAYTPTEQLTAHMGKGLVAIVDGHSVEVGTAELFAALKITIPAQALEVVDRFHRDAQTAMLVHREGRWGVIIMYEAATCPQSNSIGEVTPFSTM